MHDVSGAKHLVRDVMTPAAATIACDASLKDAAALMKSHDVGSLPVCEEKRVVGVVTDRDIVVRAVAEGLAPETKVQSVMTQGVVYCNADKPIEEAAHLMQEKQIRRLVVVEGDQSVVGMLSLGDIAVRSGDGTLGGEVLESVSEPVVHEPVVH